MCGRVTVRTPPKALAEALGLIAEGGLPEVLRFNVAPSAWLPAVLDAKPDVLSPLRWGLVPHWAEDASISQSLANARAETAAQRRAFRDALRARRCLILVDGFYEWRREGKRRRAFHFERADGAPLAFAGLWEEWRGAPGAPLRTCTVLTCAANETMAALHDRMPAILERPDWSRWLAAGAAPEELLVPAAKGVLTLRAVSSRVNDARNEGPLCLGPPEVEPQLQLF